MLYLSVRKTLLCLVCLLGMATACVPVQPSSAGGGNYVATKTFRTEDFIYEPNIKTILFYPYSDGLTDVLDVPVVYLGDAAMKLRLEFDELGDQYYNYYFKVVHCNADWTVSALNDADIVSEYNEYVMDSYEISQNTRKPYVHYVLTVPKVKVSGNYIVMVYRNGSKEDFVLTRRFIVYDNKVTVTPNIGFSSGVEQRFKNQQIDFQVKYGAYQLINPAQTVSVVLRQNNRWDNAIYNLKPMFLREEDALLDYTFFNLENNFQGGNEFRSVDLRSIRFNGQNVARTKFNNTEAEVWLMPDVPRGRQAYAQLIDINGRFVIENYETRRGATEADYVYTNFMLKAPQMEESNVYVYGLLTDWKLDKNFMMNYDSTEQAYRVRVPLKQGFYNYEYVVVDKNSSSRRPDETYLEGTYNATENRYEILVYYRPIGARADQLIGYNLTKYWGR